ncbi:unnamed protein product [Heterobilharzia americana]|nr:unnamed protein product [Heterobilharzia americana]
MGGSIRICETKMRQTTLVPSGGLSSQSVNENLWETTESLLVYKHPKCEPSAKILGLDLDGTIIIPSSGKVFPKDYTDWKLINNNILPKLKEYFDKGYKVVLLSNQRGITKGYQDIPNFKLKIQNIVEKLNIPVQALFSILEDKNRNSGVSIDSFSSFYCGDAAGRLAYGSRKKDHSCCDRLFALNIGIRFVTPEELWFNQSDTDKFEMPKFNPTELLSNNEIQNAKMPSIQRLNQPELVLLIGYPASGKSHFCCQVLAPLGYEIISRDVIGTWQKCVQAAEEAIAKKQSVVVWDIPVRCFIMETSFEHAQHNEKFRALTNSSHKPISSMVFNMMKSKYEKPTLEEGFQEILSIPFILDKNMEHLSLYCKYLLEK